MLQQLFAFVTIYYHQQRERIIIKKGMRGHAAPEHLSLVMSYSLDM